MTGYLCRNARVARFFVGKEMHMNYEKLSGSIRAVIDRRPGDNGAYSDLFSLCREWETEDFSAAHKMNKELLALSADQVVRGGGAKFYEQWRRCLLFEAPHDFDSFMTYIELDRKPEKRFYAPRKHYLRPMVQGFQDVLDGKLRLLTISMPKRAGKSQTGINFVNMLSGKFPDRSTLMEGTGDDLVKSFYNGCLEYLTVPNEYLFYDVFPDARLVQTNADTKTVNLKSKSRFPTIMCRSIDARQVGLSEATNVLYLDDCVEGREEAKNRQRLDDKWEVISGDIMGRAIEGTPMVFTGTRYSLYDPIGRVQEHAQREGWAWRAIEIPALDLVTDESNYEYEREGKKVFTTAYFREQRELLSAEQFESEFQQQPFEAKGLLFNKEELNYFFELPKDRDPDTIIAVGDTAESGSDSTSMPVAKIYGSDVYIVDVVFDDSPAEVTKPECAKCLIENKVASAVFESNNAGQYYARDVDQIIRDRGYSVGIRTKRTISNKQTRIEFASDNIKKNFYFKHPSTYKRGSQYWNFMKEVTTYTRSGKVPHDDAPDSLSLLENEIRMLSGSKVEVFKRPI
jgi:predicted phage terminase large subunit-like protein|uniref:Terminase n=1 Tax=Siphoviridae sp. ctvxh7 TaxID=2827283 RepID=A0A8S5RA65_9CAUD|nr:MAG TPA: Terminase [Siphoviridae sp. ctvxh7]